MSAKTGATAVLPAWRVALLASLAMTLWLLPGTGTAQAALTVANFTASTASTAAGAHSDGTATFSFRTTLDAAYGVIPVGGIARDIDVKLPPGLAGNAQAVPQCPAQTFRAQGCAVDTQIGTGFVIVNGAPAPEHGGGPEKRIIQAYNLVPPSTKVVLFGLQVDAFGVLGQQLVSATVHAEDDYAVTLSAPETPRPTGSIVDAVSLTLWGVPADPSHDPLRACNQFGGSGNPFETLTFGCSSDATQRPFVRNPTDCSKVPFTTFLANTYEEPEVWAMATAASPAPTECQSVPFNPRIQLTPESDKADDPTGLSFELDLPQSEDPAGQGTSDLRKAVAKLPPGMTMSPPAADGLGGCTPAQVGLESEQPAQCPNDSKIGTAEVDSPVLPSNTEPTNEAGTEGALEGSVYVGRPEDGLNAKPPYTIYVELQGHGLDVKLKGSVEPDPQTGQVTTTFADNPELPFDHFILHFKGGSRAPLVTPSTCGRQTITTEITPYSDPQHPVTPPSSFTTSYDGHGAPCPATRPFQPAVDAGTEDAGAGKTAAFHLHLNLPDGNQPIESLEVTPPPGFAAYLRGVPYCPDLLLAVAAGRSGQAEQASPSCPLASRLGTVTTAAGAGDSPLYVKGTAYLAGPYQGAPLSVAFITPAVAGPFDLGNVVVRAALHVGLETAQITVDSGSIPHILGGVPLQLRSVDVAIDRPDFTLNPTSCDRMSILTAVDSIFANEANVANPFQVGGCSALGFAPKLAISLKGATKRSGHPALKAVVTYPAGSYSSIASAQVALPHSEFLDQGNLDHVCTRPELASQTCPKSSIYGRAKAWTPLLDEPLEGPVYLSVGFGHKLPDLAAELDGQIRVILRGRVDTDAEDGIRNTFEAVPDAPVSKFVLEMQGGKSKGLLENSESICRTPQRAQVRFTAHNGKVEAFRPLIANSCGAKSKKRGRSSPRS